MNKIAEEINALAQESKAKFISFKFIDSSGQLQQIDSFIANLNFENDAVLLCDLKLKPIANKFFLDPFRSFPTIFCLCENLAYDLRSFFKENLEIKHKQGLALECSIEFTALDKNNNSKDDNYGSSDFLVDPHDKLANLRSEIILALENALICSTHHYATGFNRGVIGFKAKDFLELSDNFIVVKYIISNMAESYGKSVDFTLSSNNKVELENLVVTAEDQESYQRFTDVITRENSALSKFTSTKFSNNYDSQNNKLVINFDNTKINPYQTFSFFNLNNYKTDIVVEKLLKKMITK